MNAREVLQALDAMEPAMREAYLAQIASTISAATLAQVEQAIAERDESKVMALLPVGLFAGFVELMRAGFVKGGSAEIGGIRVAGLVVGKQFDAYEDAAAEFLRSQRGTLLDTALTDRQNTIRSILEAGQARGQSASKTALDLIGRTSKQTGRRSGGVLGLSGPFTDSVIAARAELTSNDPAMLKKYLRRKRRDPRYDKAVTNATETGKRLSVESINTIAGRYSERLLDTQAMTIAATFAAQAVSEGRDQAWRQANASTGGLLLVTKTWNSRGDAFVRGTHISLNRQKVHQDQPFQSPSGARLMHPGDVSLGAPMEEIANCRCAAEYSATRIGR